MHKVLYRAGGIWVALIPVPVISGAYESNYVLEWMRIPFVEALLAAVIFVSILAEIKTAGFSGGGLIAVIAGGLLLGSGWYGGNVAWFEFLLYFGGIALILLDILSSFPVWRGGGYFIHDGRPILHLWRGYDGSLGIIRSHDSCYYRYILFGGSFVRNRMWKNYLLHYLYLPPRICFFCSEFEEV